MDGEMPNKDRPYLIVAVGKIPSRLLMFQPSRTKNGKPEVIITTF